MANTDILSPGTLVVAKLGGHPYWPGVIGVNTATKLSMLPSRGKSERIYWVYFYNSYTGDWILRNNVEYFNPETVAKYILPNITRAPMGLSDCAEESFKYENLQGALDEANDRLEETTRVQEECWDATELRVGDVVLAKFEGFPTWPGVITASDHTYEKSLRGKWKAGDSVHVMFLPDSKENWVALKCVRKYTREKAARTKVRENNVLFKLYEEALKDADARKLDFDSRAVPPWVVKEEEEIVELTNREKMDILG